MLAMNEAVLLAESREVVDEEAVAKLYADVYQHIDEMLVQLDRNFSEKLTDIRMTRQQIDQSIHMR